MDKITGVFHFILNHNVPQDFMVSQWQSSDRSFNYVIYRWIIAIFFIFSSLTSATEDLSRGAFSTHLIYFTNLNLNLSVVMTFTSAVLVTKYYRGNMMNLKLDGKMTKTLKCFWMLSSTVVSSSCLASFTYWAVIHDPDVYKIDLCNILVHATNSLVLLLDMCIVRQPARLSVIVFPILTAITYLVFTWLYTVLGGVNRFNEKFIYHILNWNEDPKNSMIVSATLIFFLAVFHVMITVMQKVRQLVHRIIENQCVDNK